MKENEVLTMRGINKTFPGVKALNGVDFTLRKGEIHALMGENGAGKSTLIKVLTGVYDFEAGEIRVDGTDGPVLLYSYIDVCVVEFFAGGTGKRNRNSLSGSKPLS